MTFYALRHKPTGRFMPARMSHAGRAGWTWWDPTDSAYSGYTEVPRLFTTMTSVKNAAKQWLRGPIRMQKSTDWETNIVEDIRQLRVSAPQPRLQEELEIVTVELVSGDTLQVAFK